MICPVGFFSSGQNILNNMIFLFGNLLPSQIFAYITVTVFGNLLPQLFIVQQQLERFNLAPAVSLLRGSVNADGFAVILVIIADIGAVSKVVETAASDNNGRLQPIASIGTMPKASFKLDMTKMEETL